MSPVRSVHLGLGSFFRAHQAWYTDRAGVGSIAAFAGRRPELAAALDAQGGAYTLVTRGPEVDGHELVRSVSRALPATDSAAWLDLLASPDVQHLTTTVTEAGYPRGRDGGLDLARPDVARDLEVLRAGGDDTGTVPGRLVAGLRARQRADAGPLTLVPCDNLPDNGGVLGRLVRELAELADPALAGWLEDGLVVATTVVDRITPAPTAQDRASVLAATGRDDPCCVVTEPFSEWVVAGELPGGRDVWSRAGVTFTDDVTPYEQRKLWLLNGAHSLLACLGLLRGLDTVDEAVRDDECAAAVRRWWALCRPHLAQDPVELDAYCAQLLARWDNRRMRHALAQIATDSSQKLPVRFLPVLRLERDAGRLPEPVVTVFAAWLLVLRSAAPAPDVRRAELAALARRPLPDAVRGVLGALDPALPDDAELVQAVRARASELRR